MKRLLDEVSLTVLSHLEERRKEKEKIVEGFTRARFWHNTAAMCKRERERLASLPLFSSKIKIQKKKM